jgi:hypothetical protein
MALAYDERLGDPMQETAKTPTTLEREIERTGNIAYALDQFVFGERPQTESNLSQVPMAQNYLQRMLDQLERANSLLERTISELRPIKDY